jgi:hypothetical protein
MVPAMHNERLQLLFIAFRLLKNEILKEIFYPGQHHFFQKEMTKEAHL